MGLQTTFHAPNGGADFLGWRKSRTDAGIERVGQRRGRRLCRRQCPGQRLNSQLFEERPRLAGHQRVAMFGNQRGAARCAQQSVDRRQVLRLRLCSLESGGLHGCDPCERCQSPAADQA